MRGGVGETESAKLDIEDLQEFIKNPPAYNASEFDTPFPGMPYALVNNGVHLGVSQTLLLDVGQFRQSYRILIGV